MNKPKKTNNKKSITKKNIPKTYIYAIATSILLILIIGGYFTMNNENKNNKDIVIIETSLGDITVQLDREHAPITVENFLQYVDSGFYKQTIFHRVIDGFMIQGGGFTVKKVQKNTSKPIQLESDNGLSNLRGTIAMARTNDPNSATSQFFINHIDNNFLDKSASSDGYAVFGSIIEGMDIVDKIAKVRTGNVPMKDWPVEDVVIIDIKRK